MFPGLTRFEQFAQGGLLPSLEGFGSQGARTNVERSGRDHLAGLPLLGLALAIDPLQADGGAGIRQLTRHRHGLAGPDFEGIADLDGLHAHELGIDQHGLRDRGITQQLAPVPGDGDLLHPAPAEHEEDEHGDKIEVPQAGHAGDPAPQRSEVGGEDAEGDGRVDVQHAQPQGTPGA